MNVNAKYDDDKMNPFMSDQTECEWFVGPEISSYTGPPQSSTCLTQGGKNYTGPLISFVICITYKWNLSIRWYTAGYLHTWKLGPLNDMNHNNMYDYDTLQ